MSRRAKAADADWSAWTAEQAERHPVIREALLAAPGRPLEAVGVRRRYTGGGTLVTLEDGSARVVPDHWIEEG